MAKARVFGFDESASEMDDYAKKADNAMKELVSIAEDMRDTAKEIFAKVSTMRTGKGQSGIEIEKKTTEVLVGWETRPNLHGYFHELGFHALDNRHKKQRISRTGKSRKRMYRRVKATYVPPRPHMRPAFGKHIGDMEIRVQNKIT